MSIEQCHRRSLGLLPVGLDVIEPHADALHPLAVGFGSRQGVLELLVVDDAAFFEVDEEHLARLQTPLLDDLFFRDLQAAALGTHDHQIVVGHDVACRTQAVAVECRADLAPIGERNRCRAVPGLHHRRVVFVERAPARVHEGMAFPCLGNHHHHRMRNRVSGTQQKFKRTVKRGRVGLAFIDERPELVEVTSEHGRRYRALAGAQPVHVATQRVDLTVMGDQTERVRELPGRKSIGGKPLVHQRQRGHAARILQILVIATDLAREQHALVHDGARRHRRHVVLHAMCELEPADRVARGRANNVEFSLQRIGHRDASAAADEHLADGRLRFLH